MPMRFSLLAVLLFAGCARPNPSFDLASGSSSEVGTITMTGPMSDSLPGSTTEASSGSSSNSTSGLADGATEHGATEGVETGGEPSGSSSSSGSESSSSSAASSSSDSGEPGNQLVVEGLGSFATACVDPDCGAREACQHVTAKDCVWVPYDAQNLNVGGNIPVICLRKRDSGI